LNAITKDGWVEGAKLTFKSSKKTGDYHGQMNHELFTKWFIEQLLLNIPNNSLIIMDNASIHNTLSKHSAPSASSKKDDISAWLKQNGIPVQDDCLKAELVEILKRIAPAPTYALDEIATEQGKSCERPRTIQNCNQLKPVGLSSKTKLLTIVILLFQIC